MRGGVLQSKIHPAANSRIAVLWKLQHVCHRGGSCSSSYNVFHNAKCIALLSPGVDTTAGWVQLSRALEKSVDKRVSGGGDVWE